MTKIIAVLEIIQIRCYENLNNDWINYNNIWILLVAKLITKEQTYKTPK